jgi:hypothetical protein
LPPPAYASVTSDDASQRGASDQHAFASPAARQTAGQQLEASHHARVRCPQQADHRVTDGKLRLPDRQQNINEIGEAVMHRMGAAGSHQRAPSAGLRRVVCVGRGGCRPCHYLGAPAGAVVSTSSSLLHAGEVMA